MSDDHRIPPDPAGTQPKVDVDSLLPARVERDPEPRREDVFDVLPERVEHEAPVLAEPGEEPPHAAKFQFILGALIAVGVVGIASLLLVIGSGSSNESTGWSAWKPGDNGVDGAKEIADHVGPQYRLPTGEQLVLIDAGELKVQDLEMDVVMRDNNGDLSLLEGDAVLYKLCGLGPKCSIAKGKPSTERHLLLRREALELALYSFRYLGGIDQVVVQMPPPPGEEPSQALFFQKGDVEGQLDAPLRATLPVPAPSIKNVKKTPTASLVEQITNRGLFNFTYTQAQDARVYLVLEPRSTAAASVQPGQVQGGTGAGAGAGAGAGSGAAGSGSGSGSASGSGSGSGADSGSGAASGSGSGSASDSGSASGSADEEKPAGGK